VICPMHGYGSAAGGDAVGQSPTSVFEFGSTSAALGDVRNVTPRFPSHGRRDRGRHPRVCLRADRAIHLHHGLRRQDLDERPRGASVSAARGCRRAAHAVSNSGRAPSFTASRHSPPPPGPRPPAGQPVGGLGNEQPRPPRWHLEPGRARTREWRLQRRRPGDPAPWGILRRGRGRGRPELRSSLVNSAASACSLPWTRMEE
jgi:hypothetical protein